VSLCLCGSFFRVSVWVRSLIIAFLIAFPAILLADFHWKNNDGDFEVGISIPNDNIKIPNPLEIDLSLKYPKNYHVDIEELKKNLVRQSPMLIDPFKIHSAQNDIQNQGDFNQQTIKFFLQPQQPGDFQLSFYNIAFNSEGQKKEIISPFFEVKILLEPWFTPNDVPVGPLLQLTPQFPIAMSAENKRKFFGPESQEHAGKENIAKFEDKSFPWWYLIFLAGLGLLILSLRESIATSKRIAESEPVRLLRIKVQALRNINNLSSSTLANDKEFNQFYIDLTNAVRSYIEQKYHIPASTQTTQEFLQQAETNPVFKDETRDLLKKFLISADEVKFAQEIPSLQAAENARQNAKLFIRSD